MGLHLGLAAVPLALLADRCRAAGLTVEWADLLRDLDRLQEASLSARWDSTDGANAGPIRQVGLY